MAFSASNFPLPIEIAVKEKIIGSLVRVQHGEGTMNTYELALDRVTEVLGDKERAV